MGDKKMGVRALAWNGARMLGFKQCYQKRTGHQTNQPQKQKSNKNQKQNQTTKPIDQKIDQMFKFWKKIYIHVHPCESKPLYTNMQSFSCI
jgi:hypothetical protein